jgi:hypothetical protein
VNVNAPAPVGSGDGKTGWGGVYPELTPREDSLKRDSQTGEHAERRDPDRRKVLMVVTKPPWPPVGGCKVAVHQLISWSPRRSSTD